MMERSIQINRFLLFTCHCLLIEGDPGSSIKTPLKMSILSIPYDIEKAVRRAKDCAGLPNSEAFQKELLTGVYSR